MKTHLDELLVREVEELVKLNTSVLVLPEGSLPLQLGGLVGVGEVSVSLWRGVASVCLSAIIRDAGSGYPTLSSCADVVLPRWLWSFGRIE